MDKKTKQKLMELRKTMNEINFSKIKNKNERLKLENEKIRLNKIYNHLNLLYDINDEYNKQLRNLNFIGRIIIGGPILNSQSKILIEIRDMIKLI